MNESPLLQHIMEKHRIKNTKDNTVHHLSIRLENMDHQV